MYEPHITVITATSNIVEKDLIDDFNLQVTLLDKQSYPYVEHLVIDNASTDGTLDILKDYKNLGYLNFFSEPDSGKFEAYNKGVMRAKGKYISFISCDDFYHDIAAFLDIAGVMEQEEADFCFFPSYCCHPDGFVFPFTPAMLNVFQVPPFPRQAMFIKKSVMQELHSFDSKFKLLADYDLIIRLMLNGYKGIYFERNCITYKLGEQVTKYLQQVEAESKHIYYKNYKNLYPMSDEVLERIGRFSEMPKPLLDKLVLKFPEEDRELFYEMAQNMYELRKRAQEEMRTQERNNRE